MLHPASRGQPWHAHGRSPWRPRDTGFASSLPASRGPGATAGPEPAGKRLGIGGSSAPSFLCRGACPAAGVTDRVRGCPADPQLDTRSYLQAGCDGSARQRLELTAAPR